MARHDPDYRAGYLDGYHLDDCAADASARYSEGYLIGRGSREADDEQAAARIAEFEARRADQPGSAA